MLNALQLIIKDVRPGDAEGIVAVLNPIIEARKYTVCDLPLAERACIADFPQRRVLEVAARAADEHILGFQRPHTVSRPTHDVTRDACRWCGFTGRQPFGDQRRLLEDRSKGRDMRRGCDRHGDRPRLTHTLLMGQLLQASGSVVALTTCWRRTRLRPAGNTDPSSCADYCVRPLRRSNSHDEAGSVRWLIYRGP
jgi:hypothetical protein